MSMKNSHPRYIIFSIIFTAFFILISNQASADSFQANFTVHNITLLLGRSDFVAIHVENTGSSCENISMLLSGANAEFISNTRLNCSASIYCNISLESKEWETVYVRILPMDIGPKTLTLIATSGTITTDKLGIKIIYPLNFPELSIWAVALLCFFAVLIYLKIIRLNENSAKTLSKK